MGKDEREKLIDFCYESVKEFRAEPQKYEEMSDEELENEADWFEYLWSQSELI